MNITIIECDAEVGKVYKYKNTPTSVSGRGGTRFEPVFDYVKANMKPQPNAILYLTDLEANLNFKNPTNVPTLWVVTSDGGNEKEVPFGRGVKLKEYSE